MRMLSRIGLRATMKDRLALQQIHRRGLIWSGLVLVLMIPVLA